MKNNENKITYKNLIQATVLTILLSANSLYQLLNNGSLDLSSYNDTDEPHYLYDSLLSAQHLSSSATFYEHNNQLTFDQLYSSHSHFILSFIIGKISLLANLTAPELGLILDLFSVFLTYLLLVSLFRTLSPTQKYGFAEFGALFFLIKPHLFCSEHYFSTNFLTSLNIYSSIIDPFACLPVLRAISTQISYPLYVFYLITFSKIIKSEKLNPKFIIFLGILNGICWYIYFFAWGSIFTVTSILLFIKTVTKSNLKHLLIYLKNLSFFVLGNIIISGFGIYKLFSSKNFIPYKLNYTPQVMYFNLEVFILFFVFVFLYYKTKDNNYKFIYLLSSSLYLAHELLMNTNIFLRSYMQSYHFIQIYIQPLSTGLIALLLLNLINEKVKNNLLKKTIFYLTIAFFIVTTSLSFIIENKYRSRQEPVKKLASFVHNNLPNKRVFAFPTRIKNSTAEFDLNIFPHPFYAATNQYLLSLLWSIGSISLAENTERELLLGFIYNGNLNFTQKCIEPFEKSPIESFVSGMPYWRNIFDNFCRHSLELQRTDNNLTCTLLKKYKVDYVIFSRFWGINFTSNITSSFMKQIWSDKDEISLYEFDQNAAINYFCNNN